MAYSTLMLALCAAVLLTAQGAAAQAITEANLAQGAYPTVAVMVDSSAAASSNQFGNLYSPGATPLANATIASNLSPFQLFIEPCSYLVPHYHPRSDEWEFTYAGTPTGFLVPESFIGAPLNFTLAPGMQAVYPQATMHSQSNFGCETVKISVAFHSSNAGFVIPTKWTTNFPGFDTTLPPAAQAKLDEANAALEAALKANPEEGSTLYQVYFRYAGFRPMPKSACTCPGRPSIEDYAGTLDTGKFKSMIQEAMASKSAASPPGPAPTPPSPSSGAHRASIVWAAALALLAHALFGAAPGGLKQPLLVLALVAALASPAFGQQIINPPAGPPTETALAQGAYAVYANLTTQSAAVSGNQFGTLYSGASTALANATVAGGISPLILEINPCAFLVPHYHPRGDEWEFTYAGVTTGYLTPESYIGPALNYTLTPGMQAVYPQATLHSQANFGCNTTKISVYFPTSSPGFVIPNDWALDFLPFDTTLPPAAQAKVDTISQMAEEALMTAKDPSKVYQLIFSVLGFRPIPAAACSCPGLNQTEFSPDPAAFQRLLDAQQQQ